jgi:hypothetical protein
MLTLESAILTNKISSRKKIKTWQLVIMISRMREKAKMKFLRKSRNPLPMNLARRAKRNLIRKKKKKMAERFLLTEIRMSLRTKMKS